MPLTMDEYEYLREEIEQVQGLVRLAEVQAKLADVLLSAPVRSTVSSLIYIATTLAPITRPCFMRRRHND
ncbi:hypothetical protein ROA7745_04562 [Roseovarius aestuarii]|uniref:Uncharacterized protein n=1 Tax=Roseovarius aestuarii TaxID=475083 RepID=A0A1X7BYN9_9RHOB|nr:hypothetical protein ROA7745_04562 [Roseovarius aestuarii]